jgi:UrcA family protein
MQVLKSIRHPFCSLAFACVICLAGATQAAAGEVLTRQVTVNYHDLNLATIQGATALYTRLRGAARNVCDQPAAGLHAHRAWQACYRAAMAQAVARINSPLLSAVNDRAEARATTTAMLIR